MDFAFILKKTITLLVLVDPLMAIPIFLAATRNVQELVARRFALTLGLTVAAALGLASVAGQQALQMLGVTLGAIQVAGGAIAFLVAIAMVLAKEGEVKMSAAESDRASAEPAIVPLGIPLLVGPASLSFVIATSSAPEPAAPLWANAAQLVIPPLIAGLATWWAFALAARAGAWVKPTTANVVERLAGFLLAAISVEMVAGGLRALFPRLA